MSSEQSKNDELVAISDRMVPGAGAVHVNRVIDLLMTVENDENRELLTAAMTALDGQAGQRTPRNNRRG